MNYSIQFAVPAQRLKTPATRRARAWNALLAAYLAAHPGREQASVTVLEVSLWKAARR